MPFDRPTLSELVTRTISDIQTRITGASTLLRYSILRVLAKVQAGGNHLLYGYLEYIAKQTFILYADESGLRDHGVEWGLDRGESDYAVGNVVITGTTGLIVPEGTELSDADGLIYEVDSDSTLVAGTVTASITAQQKGADYNQEAGVILRLVSPISGIDNETTIDSDGLNDGTDIEDLEDWRTRLLARKRNPPHGGAEHDYQTWMLEVNGVTRSWTFPLYNGAGTIGCAFVRDDEDPIIPDVTEIATVRAYIVSHTDTITGKIVGCPVTAEPGLYMITLTEKEVNLTVSIYPNTSAIQSAATNLLNDALITYGGPGETVYLSQLQKALAQTSNLEYFKIDSPVADITATQTEVHVPGTYTFQDY